MNKNLFVLFVLFLNLTACYDMKSNKIEQLYARDLDQDQHTFNTIFFINKDTGFIAGSYDSVWSNPDKASPQFALMKQTALLYQTIDGGKTWREERFGEGAFLHIIQSNRRIYAVLNSDRDNHSDIYLYDKQNNVWNLSFSFPTVINNIFDIHNGQIIVAQDSSRNFRFYISTLNKKGWHIIFPESNILSEPIVLGDSIIYVSTNDKVNFSKNILVCANTKSLTKIIISLPEGFEADQIASCDGKVKIVGVKDGKIAIYSLESNKEFKHEGSYGGKKDVYTIGWFYTPTETWIIARKTGNADKFILKTDNANHWDIIHFKREQLIEPFCFLQAKNSVKAWFFGGLGRIQVMD